MSRITCLYASRGTTVPSHYSSKLDCFSYGVLTIQIATRKFPKPGSDRKFIEDPNYATGRVFMQVSEKERRKNHIDLIEPDHPLLHTALQCLEDMEDDRPSAGEIYEKLGKLNANYASSPIEPQFEKVDRDLYAQLELVNSILRKEQADYLKEIKSKSDFIDDLQKEIRHKEAALENHQTESKDAIADLEVKNADMEKEKLKEKEEFKADIHEKDDKITNLQRNLEETNKLLLEERGNHQVKLKEKDDTIIELETKILTNSLDLDEIKDCLLKERADHQTELKGKNDTIAELQTELRQLEKCVLLAKERAHHQVKEDVIIKLEQEKEALLREKDDYRKEIGEKDNLIYDLQIETALNADDLERQRKIQLEEKADNLKALRAKDDVVASLQKELQKKNFDLEDIKQLLDEKDKHHCEEIAAHQAEIKKLTAQLQRTSMHRQDIPIKKWRSGTQPPSIMKNGIAYWKKAYFSDGSKIYSYAVAERKWAQIQPSCEFSSFAMAIIDGYLVTIGGQKPDGYFSTKLTNSLQSLLPDKLHKSKWKEALPSMGRSRVNPAAVTSSTHLVVAGGGTDLIELLDLTTYKWSSVKAQIASANLIQIKLCSERLYLLKSPSLYSCSLEELLRVRKGDCSVIWKTCADVPRGFKSTLVTMKDSLLAIGGQHQGKPADVIQRYDEALDSWSVIETLPPRLNNVVAVALYTSELILADRDHLALHIGTDIL